MNSDTSIFVGRLDNVVWVRIEGIATKDTSCGIRQYFSESLKEGHREFIIDLEECRMIDSTFIGILTGLAGKLEEGAVKVIHPNERNQKSICKLGLNTLITLEPDGVESEDEARTRLDPLLDDERERVQQAAVILQAHEELSSINERNAADFKDVLDYLRRDLESITKN